VTSAVDTTSAPTADQTIAAAIQQIATPYQTETQILGPSKIISLLTCARQYELQYIERVSRLCSPAAAVGTCFHSVAEHARRSRWSAEHADAAADLMLRLWEEAAPLTSDPASPDANKRVQGAVTEWLPWYLWWYGKQQPILTEERWTLDVPGTDCQLRGTIDSYYSEQGQRVLSDIKTGARKPSESDLRMDLQLTLYWWACREMGSSPTVAEQCLPAKQMTVRTTRTDEFIDATIERVVIPAARFIEGGVFPANPASRYGCGYCDVRQHCPIGAGAGEGEAA
jgi:hypothetical protein